MYKRSEYPKIYFDKVVKMCSLLRPVKQFFFEIYYFVSIEIQ